MSFKEKFSNYIHYHKVQIILVIVFLFVIGVSISNFRAVTPQYIKITFLGNFTEADGNNFTGKILKDIPQAKTVTPLLMNFTKDNDDSDYEQSIGVKVTYDAYDIIIVDDTTLKVFGKLIPAEDLTKLNSETGKFELSRVDGIPVALNISDNKFFKGKWDTAGKRYLLVNSSGNFKKAKEVLSVLINNMK